ncbi:MAG: hypothetical protein ILP22_09260 [Oscillospiraceae bacterium]|nr:hypothetical protein [Oscillospiraceae bacterium]
MITVKSEKCNTFTQKNYDEFIGNLNLNSFRCSNPKCFKRSCLTIHGYYYRYLKIGDKKIRLRIMRIKCSECGCTHAVMPSFVVPYSQVTYHVQKQICEHSERKSGFKDILAANLSIDESDIANVIRRYRKHWKTRIVSLGVSVFNDIMSSCFEVFRRQFMQIKMIFNTLQGVTT